MRVVELHARKGVVKVYRFENQHRQGPFTGGASSHYDSFQQICAYHCCDSMPTPYEEPEGTALRAAADLGSIRGNYVFGFKTLSQLGDAFPSAAGRAAMGSKGIRLNVYEVPSEDVLLGVHQVAFKTRHARLIEERDLYTLRVLESRPQTTVGRKVA